MTLEKENKRIRSTRINFKLNVLIPMAGEGSRFSDVGYTMPKPLIKVNLQPMIQLAVENLNLDANYIYVVKKEHRDKYNLDAILNRITPHCTIIETDGLTDGPVCTALLAKQYIDNENPIFFANSDQFVEWDSKRFIKKMKKEMVDGGIVTFKSNKRHFGYVKTNEDGYVEKVAKNNPISDDANTGYYYWKHGSDFVKYAEQMVSKNISYNNEFFIDEVYNEAIEDGKQITIFNAKDFWSLGTPKELNYFLQFYEADNIDCASAV